MGVDRIRFFTLQCSCTAQASEVARSSRNTSCPLLLWTNPLRHLESVTKAKQQIGTRSRRAEASRHKKTMSRHNNILSGTVSDMSGSSAPKLTKDFSLRPVRWYCDCCLSRHHSNPSPMGGWAAGSTVARVPKTLRRLLLVTHGLGQFHPCIAAYVCRSDINKRARMSSSERGLSFLDETLGRYCTEPVQTCKKQVA